MKGRRDLVEYLCGQMLLNSAFEKKMKIQEVDGDADGAAPGFIASAAHTGSKAGYVFKMVHSRAHSMS